MKAYAVFEGGGVKGLALVGALWAAESRGYTWQNVAGTSAGAIVAALVAAGYTAEEIKKLMFELDLPRLKDAMGIGCIPLVGKAVSLFWKKGLYKGEYFTTWLRSKLAAKGVTTFRDLKYSRGHHEHSDYKLQIIAADISRGKMLVLPEDIADYGLAPDDLEVAIAVRMSMSIPLYYEPVKWNFVDGKGRQTVSYIVDGGILSNYPLWLFDTQEEPEYPTFGFRLGQPPGSVRTTTPHTISGPISLMTAMVSTMMDAHDRKHIEEVDFARTIYIPTWGVGVTDFHLSELKKTELFQSGKKAANNFFKDWDFPAYLSSYRVMVQARKEKERLA
ncbi:MAG TPA: patatin-like phospholipase family protein [Bacillota bacterium]|nr:patatin-like phospholipase family protein [Bacillota bacterium]